MENLVTIIFLGISLISLGIVVLYFILIKNQNESSPKKSLNHNSQDFSAFESDPNKFRSSLDFQSVQNTDEDEEEGKENTIQGDLSNLEEFINTIKSQPRETLSEIQISKDAESDILIALEVDEEDGLFMEVYFPDEDTTILYEQWLSAIHKLISELSLDAEEIEKDDDVIIITVEGKSANEIRQLIERILSDCYLHEVGSNLFIEYFA